MTDAGAGEVGVYVHWPYCARICPYCDFNVVRAGRRSQQPEALAKAILADLAAQAAGTGRRRLVSIFFGGGTPSLADPDWVAALIASAREHLDAGDDLEVTLEANPTDAETGRFAALRDAGVNRLSLGVQALDDAALAFLGRNHDAAEARRAAETALATFPRVSLDLIYALPGQTPAAWAAALREAVALGPEHLSPYQLTIEAGTPFDRAVARRRWSPPDPDTAAALYETTQEVLTAAGYDTYEVSNHARGDVARSRHNLTYWRGGDYLGVGPGAHGRVTSDGARWATVTPAGIDAYIARVATAGDGLAERTRLRPLEAAQERLLMGLRTLEGVARADLEPLDIDPAAIDALAAAGLIAATPERLIASPAGRAVLDRLTLDLAAAARAD